MRYSTITPARTNSALQNLTRKDKSNYTFVISTILTSLLLPDLPAINKYPNTGVPLR